jgi:hypothetical protein
VPRRDGVTTLVGHGHPETVLEVWGQSVSECAVIKTDNYTHQADKGVDLCGGHAHPRTMHGQRAQ